MSTYRTHIPIYTNHFFHVAKISKKLLFIKFIAFYLIINRNILNFDIFYF